MTSKIKTALIQFAKSKKGTNVRFRGTTEYTKGHAKGLGECQDLVDLGLKTAGGRMDKKTIATPTKGALVEFKDHKTTLTLTIEAMKNGKKEEIWSQGAVMTRPNHIAIVDEVILGGIKVWVWEQNVTPDKKTVRQPVRNDKYYLAARKTFSSKTPVTSVKQFLEWKLGFHATERHRGDLAKVDWNLVKAWMDAGYDVFVKIELKSTGMIKFHEVVEDTR